MNSDLFGVVASLGLCNRSSCSRHFRLSMLTGFNKNLDLKFLFFRYFYFFLNYRHNLMLLSLQKIIVLGC